MKRSSIFFLVPIVLLSVAGCSQQSKQEYQAAGQSLTHAAQETGKAVKQDAQVAAKATQNAATAAKTTVSDAKSGDQKGKK